jgi:hypothetical protein
MWCRACGHYFDVPDAGGTGGPDVPGRYRKASPDWAEEPDCARLGDPYPPRTEDPRDETARALEAMQRAHDVELAAVGRDRGDRILDLMAERDQALAGRDIALSLEQIARRELADAAAAHDARYAEAGRLISDVQDERDVAAALARKLGQVLDSIRAAPVGPVHEQRLAGSALRSLTPEECRIIGHADAEEIAP